MTNVKVGQINYFNNQPLKNNGEKASLEQSHEATLGKFFNVVGEVLHWHCALSLSAPRTDDKKRK